MMKKIVISILCLTSLTMNLFSQSDSLNQLDRKVVFTLNTNETIFNDEYAILTDLQGHYFAATIYDTVKKKHSIIFNGVRIVEDIDFYNEFSQFKMYINPRIPNSYSIVYRKKEDYYVNIEGKVYGPFESAFLESEKQFAYILNRKYYINLDGIAKGPFLGWVPEKFTESGKYIYRYLGKTGVYVDVNGKPFGPFQSTECSNQHINDNGIYAFGYQYDDDSTYVNINGNILGPFRNISDISLTKSGQYAFKYNLPYYSKEYYINHNGLTIGPFFGLSSDSWKCLDTNSFAINDSEKLLYSFHKDSISKDVYINNNGIIAGPYGKCKFSHIADNGKVIYCYTEVGNKDEEYIYNDGEISGPYRIISNFAVSESGKLAFSYAQLLDNGKLYYIYNDGEIMGPYSNADKVSFDKSDNINFIYNTENFKAFRYSNGESFPIINMYQQFFYSLKINSDDNKHLFVSNEDSLFVTIDDKNYGKNFAISVFFIKARNSFVWNTIEGRELVIYEYHLK